MNVIKGECAEYLFLLRVQQNGPQVNAGNRQELRNG